MKSNFRNHNIVIWFGKFLLDLGIAPALLSTFCMYELFALYPYNKYPYDSHGFHASFVPVVIFMLWCIAKLIAAKIKSPTISMHTETFSNGIIIYMMTRFIFVAATYYVDNGSNNIDTIVAMYSIPIIILLHMLLKQLKN